MLRLRSREAQKNGPAAERQADRVQAAAEVIRQRTLFELIERVAVDDAHGDRGNHQPSEEAEMPPGISDDKRERRRCTMIVSGALHDALWLKWR